MRLKIKITFVFVLFTMHFTVELAFTHGDY